MTKTEQITPLEREIAAMLKAGGRQVSMVAMRAELLELGYELEMDMRASGVARNLTTGNSYPSVTYGVREIDTRMSAFHFQARRDPNFKALQAWRFWTFAVVRGAMVTV